MQTRAKTHTSTHARHIAAKVAADLKRVQRIYGFGRPSDAEIDEYQEELTLLLDNGYLGTVTYGFQRDDNWVAALKYRALQGGLSNNGPGGVIYPGGMGGAPFGSFLMYSEKWRSLDAEQRDKFEKSLPFQRAPGNEPGVEGWWVEGRRYSSGSLGVSRSMITRTR